MGAQLWPSRLYEGRGYVLIEIYIYILEDLKTHHHNFAIFSQTVNAIEKLLAALNVQPKITGIIPFSDCGEFAASLVSGVISFMVEGTVGSVKG